MHNEPHVTILLATYNGAQYLSEQLNSIVQQTHKHRELVASDDGSTDLTLEILRQYPIKIHYGKQQGYAANFLYLIDLVDDSSDYYAFADQDDFWESDKLQRALEALKEIPNEQPALYCGRTLLVDEQLTPLGLSPLFKKPSGFLNALVQNIGGGNTMVFNRAAFLLLCQTQNQHTIVAHDWWAYLLVSGAGGRVIYDPTPALRYRQHQDNLIGSNVSWLARFYRIRMLFQGRWKSWINQNNKSLLEVSHLLTSEHRQQLEQFESARHQRFFPRIISILSLGIYRQTYFGQLGLIIGTLFKKI